MSQPQSASEPGENDDDRSDYMSESLTMSDSSDTTAATSTFSSTSVNATQSNSSIRDGRVECAICHQSYSLADLEQQTACEHSICVTCLADMSLAEQHDGSMCPAPVCRYSKWCPSDEDAYASLGSEYDESQTELITAISSLLMGLENGGIPIRKEQEKEQVQDTHIALSIYIFGENSTHFDQINMARTKTLEELKMYIQQQWDEWLNGALYWCTNGTFDASDGELFEQLDVDADGQKTLDQLGLPDGAHVALDIVGELAVRLSLAQALMLSS